MRQPRTMQNPHDIQSESQPQGAPPSAPIDGKPGLPASGGIFAAQISRLRDYRQYWLWGMGQRAWIWFRNQPIDRQLLTIALVPLGLWLAKHTLFEIPFFFHELERIKDFAHSGMGENQVEASRHLTTTIGTMLGGAIALSFVIWRQTLMQRQTKAQEHQTRVAEQTQLTTLLSKSIDQLGATREVKLPIFDDKDKPTKDTYTQTEPNIEVRIGAIYTLERIAHDSKKDQNAIINILRAYTLQSNIISDLRLYDEMYDILNNPDPQFSDEFASPSNWYIYSHWKEKFKTTKFDTQTAMRSIFNIKTEHKSIIKMQHMSLVNTDLTNIDFSNSDISGSIFIDCDLGGSIFRNTIINNCYFIGTDLHNTTSITQEQIDTAMGAAFTRLPVGIQQPHGWSSWSEGP